MRIAVTLGKIGLVCSILFSGGIKAQAEELTLAVAASLQPALESLRPQLEALKPGVRLHISPGASGTLRQQIIHGAPIDIFISAATEPMMQLENLGQLAPGSRRVLLGNQLILVGPASSKIQDFEGLKAAHVKRIALGEPRTVPAGMYAEQVLKFLRLDAVLRPKFIYAKDVRQVLSYLERGEVDAGFIYQSDLKGAKNLRQIASMPNGSHDPIQYSIAIVKRSQQQAHAARLLTYLQGPEAAAVWKSYGFLPAPSSAMVKGKARAR